MKKTKIEFSIEAVENQHKLVPENGQADEIKLDFNESDSIMSSQQQPSEIDTLYEAYQEDIPPDDTMAHEGVSEQIWFTNQDASTSQSIQPTDDSTQEISGNLLAMDQNSHSITEIEGFSVQEIADSRGVVEVTKPEGEGVLKVYTQDFGEHKAGDFIYQLKDNYDEQASEHFTYQIQTPEGNAQLSVQFDISEAGPKVGQPEIGIVDEDALLPGNHEALETYGNLDVDFADLDNGTLTFSPLIFQKSLISANLTSNETPLYYVMNEDNTTLSAYQGANGPLVFEVSLFDDGSYKFKLHSHLDREIPENLLSDPNFDFLGKQTTFMFDAPLGWQVKETTLSSFMDKTTTDQETVILQEIQTDVGAPYHLSFYLGTPNDGDGNIEFYWNDKLLHCSSFPQAWTGFTFALETGFETISELMIIGHNLTHDINEYVSNLMLTSMSMQSLSLDFAFQLMNADEVLDHGKLTVGVATEPPIVLNHSEPFNIVYEQALYQSIILTEQTHNESKPLTTLDLDALFEQLDILEENRQVDIVQLEENGQLTNVYEVKVSDKTSTLDPITIADVQLRFQDGEGGLDVFFKNIQIHDA